MRLRFTLFFIYCGSTFESYENRMTLCVKRKDILSSRKYYYYLDTYIIDDFLDAIPIFHYIYTYIIFIATPSYYNI